MYPWPYSSVVRAPGIDLGGLGFNSLSGHITFNNDYLTQYNFVLLHQGMPPHSPQVYLVIHTCHPHGSNMFPAYPGCVALWFESDRWVKHPWPCLPFSDTSAVLPNALHVPEHGRCIHMILKTINHTYLPTFCTRWVHYYYLIWGCANMSLPSCSQFHAHSMLCMSLHTFDISEHLPKSSASPTCHIFVPIIRWVQQIWPIWGILMSGHSCSCYRIDLTALHAPPHARHVNSFAIPTTSLVTLNTHHNRNTWKWNAKC